MIYNLQLLRALAALSVVLLHVESGAGLGVSGGVGNFGVDVFFVISGFTMAYVGRRPAALFFLRRCIRIIPMYWLATLCTFGIAWIAPTLVESASASVPHLWHSLLFLPYPNKLGALQPTLALGWTLNYEMYFYLAFAVALVLARRHASWVACALLATAAGVIRFAGPGAGDAGFYADPIICEFGFGIVVYHAVMSSTPDPSTPDPRWRNSLIALALAAGLVLPLQEHLIGGARVLWAGVPAAALVLAAVLVERRCGVAARRGWVVLLGDSSYVLYLIHPYVVYGAIRLFLRPAAMGPAALVLASLALPLLAVLAAVALHLAVERPLTGWLRGHLVPQPA